MVVEQTELPPVGTTLEQATMKSSGLVACCVDCAVATTAARATLRLWSRLSPATNAQALEGWAKQ